MKLDQAPSAGRCYPVARTEELIPRRIAQVQLLGREIALWRSDDGAVHAWENRCPHRGVRLSLGTNTGTELRCRYHGWRFNGDGRCTFIPSHPTQKPASTLRVGIYSTAVHSGLVWVSLDPEIAATTFLVREDPHAVTLRSVFVAAPAAAIAKSLSHGYRISAAPEAAATAVAVFDDLTLAAPAAGRAPGVTFFLQPVDVMRTVIHGLVSPAPDAHERLAVLRHHNTQLSLLRDALERTAAAP
jgi:nitrite reductase/ring-hydroxylating ferredoxin subunit